MTVEKSILVLSTGRTGTKFFASLLSQGVENAKVYHASPGTPLLNILSNLVISKALPRKILEFSWRVLKQKEFYDKSSQSIYIDCNNHLYLIPTLLPTVYPNLHVVHIIRDPRYYIASHLAWAKQRRKSYFANFILPFWQPNGCILQDVPANSWLKYSQIERFAWIWLYKNKMLEKARQTDIPYYNLKFEDFFESDNETVKRELFNFLDFDARKFTKPTSQLENSSQPLKCLHWKSWSNDTCRKVDAICGEYMRRFGYGCDASWQERLR